MFQAFVMLLFFTIIKNICIVQEINQARRCIFNNFQEVIPFSRILTTLSIIDVVILNFNKIGIKNIIESIHDLGANILYMIGFEKLVG